MSPLLRRRGDAHRREHSTLMQCGLDLGGGQLSRRTPVHRVLWLRLGIQIQRIKPGHPEQNGRHEHMHLTLKKEATQPAAFNFLQQQERFDQFIGVYNNERPHQALDTLEKWRARQDSNLRPLPSESTRSKVSNCFICHCVAGRPLQLQQSAHKCTRELRKYHALTWLPNAV